MNFDDLKLADVVLRAVRSEGYDVPTPIQQKAIPHVLQGKDLLGCAQTGTGKTAAFALPILSRLGTASHGHPAHGRAEGHGQGHGHGHGAADGRGRSHSANLGRPIRVLVLTPTRELALQIGESFTTYGKFTQLRAGMIFGGVGQGQQERMLREGVDIVVATPGRLMDLMNQRLIHFDALEVFVLDEADRMLDMGFIADIRRIIARLPAKRQNLMFSATMPPEIQRLADGILRHPVNVAVAPVSSTAERVEQSVYFVEKRAKPALLAHLLKSDRSITRVLVFTRTKHGADRLARGLAKQGIGAEAIHGNKSQNQRQRALDTFKRGHSRVLVATDIAARGLDIERVSHVINFELPEVPESYVHRIGRTARAGESGIAISFCDAEERSLLRDIERVIASKVPVLPVPAGVDEAMRAAAAAGHPAHGHASHGNQAHGGHRHGNQGQAGHSSGARPSGGARPGGNPGRGGPRPPSKSVRRFRPRRRTR